MRLAKLSQKSTIALVTPIEAANDLKLLHHLPVGGRVPPELNTADTIARCRSYVETPAHWQRADYITVYVDECGYNTWTRRNYARSRKGTRAPIYEVGPRSRFVTVQMAVSPDDGIISYRVIPRTTTTENFTSFIAEAALSSLQLHPNSPVVFVMDNLSNYNQAALE